MGRYITRRLIQAVPLLIFISATVFALLQAAPGGPMGAYVRRGTLDAADMAALEHKLGLDRPIYVQYYKWLERVVRLDFGQSTSERRPVTAAIRDRLPNTLYLMFTAWIITLLIAIPVGILSAVKHYSAFDHT